jgi:VCBS repeat-containing protein
MAVLRTICLLWLSSFLLPGCTVVNKINVMDAFTNCPPVFRPAIHTATVTYNAQLDFYKKHISGLFVFKSMNDTTERVVFMNETGFKFFDFEFTPHNFKVQYIIPSLNKKFIVNTLQKDLGYLIVPPVENSAHEQPKSDAYTTFKFPQAKGAVYYSTDRHCEQLQKIEVGKDKKKSLIIDLTDMQHNSPQTINIAHQNFKLTIFMKQINN